MKSKMKKGGGGAVIEKLPGITKVPNARHCSTCKSSARSRILVAIKSKAKLLQGEYLVEKIVARRTTTRDVKYLVQWKGYSESCNTWEPAKNLFKCKDVIAEFEKALNANRKPKKGSVNLFTKTRKMAEIELEGQRGPYKITGVGEHNGKRYFCVKWNRADLSLDTVYANEANEYWPLQIIRFYEERISWTNENEGHQKKVDDGEDADVEDNTDDDEMTEDMDEDEDEELSRGK